MSGLEAIIVPAATLGITLAGATKELVATDGAGKRRLKRLQRRVRVTAMDKMLRDMMEKSGEKYTIFMGTLDPLNDNLIAEAIDTNVDREDIIHTIFSCEKSSTWLQSRLAEVGDETIVAEIIRILYMGASTPWEFFAAELAKKMHEAGEIIADNDIYSYTHPSVIFEPKTSVDLSKFEKCESFHHQKGMKATICKEAIVLVTGRRLKMAMVPVPNGIDYYKRRSSPNGKTSDHWPDRANGILQELTMLGCGADLAWSLILAWLNHEWEYYGLPSPAEQEIKRNIVTSFKIVSEFRSALVDLVMNEEPPKKKLVGTKRELRQLRTGDVATQKALLEVFALGSTVFDRAQSLTVTNLYPFTSDIFESEPLETCKLIVEKLIEKAKGSDVKRGGETKFNPRTIAVLGAFNCQEVYGSVISNKVKAQFFFQDHPATKSFCTPFTTLMVFASTDDFDAQSLLERETFQSLESGEPNFANWIALRALHEFDVEKGRFRYESDSYMRAEDLLNDSLEGFIADNTTRFSQVFDSSPPRVYVSGLRRIATQIADRTGASTPWLVRELASRYIEAGAKVVNSGGRENDRYGCFEAFVRRPLHKRRFPRLWKRRTVRLSEVMPSLTRKEREEFLSPAGGTRDSGKKVVLVFDEKVSIEGVRCDIIEPGGSVILSASIEVDYDALLYNSVSGEGRVVDPDKAYKLLMKRKFFDTISPVRKMGGSWSCNISRQEVTVPDISV